MNTVMIFVLVLLSSGNRPTGLELYFQELTSCLEYRDALVYQSVHKHNFTRGENLSCILSISNLYSLSE